MNSSSIRLLTMAQRRLPGHGFILNNELTDFDHRGGRSALVEENPAP